MIVDMTKKIHEQITPESWTQKSDKLCENSKGCIINWVCERYPEWDDRLKLYNTLAATIIPDLEEDEQVIPVIYNWNDAPGRTFEEVRALFEKVNA